MNPRYFFKRFIYGLVDGVCSRFRAILGTCIAVELCCFAFFHFVFDFLEFLSFDVFCLHLFDLCARVLSEICS